MRVVEFIKRFATDARGGTAIEYGLILALVFLGLMGAVQSFGLTTQDMWSKVSSSMSDAR